MKTCASCKYWIVESEERSNPFFFASSEDLDLPNDFEVHACDSPKLREFERPERDGASVLDGSHYMATLVTGPDFGCIHHVSGGGPEPADSATP